MAMYYTRAVLRAASNLSMYVVLPGCALVRFVNLELLNRAQAEASAKEIRTMGPNETN